MTSARFEIEDAFSFRSNERILISELGSRHRFAVRALPCTPPGPMVGVTTASIGEGEPVECYAIVAARKNVDGADAGKWSWLPLAVHTKASIGELLFALGRLDTWLGMELEDEGGTA